MKSSTNSVHGDKIVDDTSVFEIEDSEGQSLQVRVGSVFYGDKGQHKEFGIWINYQEKRLESTLLGPVLVSRDTFKALINHIDDRFGDKDAKAEKAEIAAADKTKLFEENERLKRTIVNLRNAFKSVNDILAATRMEALTEIVMKKRERQAKQEGLWQS